jgi:hypothetical protein
MASSEARLVTFRGGLVASWPVVARLLDLEARGARFVLLAGGRFRVEPAAVLTVDDTAFLRQHRDEARRVLDYQADDSHLYTDRRLAQSARVPGREERTA